MDPLPPLETLSPVELQDLFFISEPTPPTFDPSLRRNPEPCCRNSRGPTILMPRKYHTACTFKRRPLSQGSSPARFFMVRARHLPVRLYTLSSFVRFALGVLIVLFFQCMATLLNPVHRRREGVKWGLVSYTMIMSSVVTVFTAMNLNIQSISYIDDRRFPGIYGFSPGPFGYQWDFG